MIYSAFGSSLDINFSNFYSVIILRTVLFLKSVSFINISNSSISSILLLKTRPNSKRASFTESHYSLYLSLALPILHSNSELRAMLISGLFESNNLLSSSSPLSNSSMELMSLALSLNDHTPISMRRRTFKIKFVLAPFSINVSISFTTDCFLKHPFSNAANSSES